MKPMIYLDVDGVILANEKYAANYADDFLVYLINNYPVTWLTTHCMDNDPETVIERLEGLLKPETVRLLTQVGGAKWSLWKTEAIDFTKPFIWLDDDCYTEEKEVLQSHDALANWVEIDLSRNENQLKVLLDSFPLAVQPKPL